MLVIAQKKEYITALHVAKKLDEESLKKRIYTAVILLRFYSSQFQYHGCCCWDKQLVIYSLLTIDYYYCRTTRICIYYTALHINFDSLEKLLSLLQRKRTELVLILQKATMATLKVLQLPIKAKHSGVLVVEANCLNKLFFSSNQGILQQQK